MAAKMRVLGQKLSSYPYLRSAIVRFPFLYIVVGCIVDDGGGSGGGG